MMKSKLLKLLVLAAWAVPGVAMAEEMGATDHKGGVHAVPASSHTVTSNIGLVSNYLYRGISQTGGNPALQGGFDYAHASGFYAGACGSNISWIPNTVASSSSFELDTYAGLKGGFAGDFSYDVGYLRYNFPGVYPAGSTTKADTDEVYGALGWKWVTLKYSHSLGDTFGMDEASGTSYVELNASYALADAGITLGAHYGKQSYKGAAADALEAIGTSPTYSDYKLSVSKDYSGYVVGLAYSSTDAKSDGFYTIIQADGSKTDLGKGTAVLSLTHAM